jgi:hypothetical protein
MTYHPYDALVTVTIPKSGMLGHLMVRSGVSLASFLSLETAALILAGARVPQDITQLLLRLETAQRPQAVFDGCFSFSRPLRGPGFFRPRSATFAQRAKGRSFAASAATALGHCRKICRA